MKILTRTAAAVLAAVTAAAVWAVPAAAAASVQGISSTSCIADNANILSRDTETYITNISVALQENCSGAQIGVYTTDYVGNNTMEGYAYEVFQAWGLGSADQDNGMVLLMATGDDNYWATPGEGLESAFSGNVLSDLLYDNLEASWAKQDYDTGARKTVLAMAERICDVYGVSLDMDAIGSGLADSSGRIVENTQSRSNGGAVLTLILLTIIIAVIVIAILKTPRGPRGPQGPTYTGGRRGPNVFFFGGPVYRPRRPRRPPPPPPPGGGFGNPGPRPGGGFGGRTCMYFIDLCKGEPRLTEHARCIKARYDSGITNHSGDKSGVLCMSGECPDRTEETALIQLKRGTPKILEQEHTKCLIAGYDKIGISNRGESSGIFYGCRAVLTPDRENKRQNGRRFKACGEPAFCLNTQDKHGVYLCACDSCEYALPVKRAKEADQSKPENGSALPLGCGRIRKLTPRECWRLQGFSDDMFDKAAAVNSDAQLYKQAGNGVTIPVVYAVGKRIVEIQNELNSEVKI